MRARRGAHVLVLKHIKGGGVTFKVQIALTFELAAIGLQGLGLQV